jgi:hypothetical protein
VSTNIEENQPMLIRPIHFRALLEPSRPVPRERKGRGMVSADTASAISASGHAGVSAASAGSRRSAM